MQRSSQAGPFSADDLAAQERALSAVLDALKTLERCLEAEIYALTSEGPEALITAVDSKRAALEAFERASRGASLGVLMEQATAESVADSSQRPRPPSWPALLEHLRRCRDLNETAGAAIAAGHRNAAATLRLLGHDPEPVCYGDDARIAGPAGRNLGIC